MSLLRHLAVGLAATLLIAGCSLLMHHKAIHRRHPASVDHNDIARL